MGGGWGEDGGGFGPPRVGRARLAEAGLLSILLPSRVRMCVCIIFVFDGMMKTF